MAPEHMFAKIALTVATIFVLGACSELTPAKRTESQNSEVLSPATATLQTDPASTDDVVTAIEEAKRMVPFVLNALMSKSNLLSPTNAIEFWGKARIVTNETISCGVETDICLSISVLKERMEKASLVRSLTALITSEVVLRLTGSKEQAAALEEELKAKLPNKPKAVLFPRIEVLYQNSHPNTGVLRNSILGTLNDLENQAEWASICSDVLSVQSFAAKLGKSEDEKNQMMASLGPDAEAEEASILRRTSNLKVYCDASADENSTSLFQNGDSLKLELQEALASLDRIYPAAKQARDLIRTFRL